MKKIMIIVAICGLTNLVFSQNFGIDDPSPAAKLTIRNGGQILGTTGTSSNTRTFTILEGSNAQINFGSYPGNWTSALQIQSNDNTRYIWLSPISNGGNARLVSVGADFDIMPGNVRAATFTSAGNVEVAGQLKISGGSPAAGRVLTSDASGLGTWTVPAGGSDNLGNHVATTTLNMNGQAITNISDAYANGWFRNNSSAIGVYNQSTGNHFYSEGNYWNMAKSGGNNGLIFRNAYAGTILGYVYSDGSNSFGLLPPSGTWRVRVDNSNVEVYGGFYSSTAYMPFIYDRDNTGYYMDPNSTSRMYYGDYNYLHTQTNDSWFPYTGNNINYFRGQAYCWNSHWYDENNTGYYLNADNTTRLAYLYQGIGANNVGGWTSGRIQTESTSDGHQYHPLTGNWGYIGTSGQYWYYSYAGTHVNVSARSLKRNITPVDNNLSELVMNDIDKIKPSFYKFKDETDEIVKGNEPKYRPNMRLGVILDESPDYIQDQAFSGIDIYALSTMTLTGVKHNREEIKEIKEAIGISGNTITISDFGNATMNGTEVWIPFSNEFIAKNSSGTVPIVTVTANQAGVVLSVVETKSNGFKVIKTNTSTASTFNWIAMTKVNVKVENQNSGTPIAADLLKQLQVVDSRKAPIKAYWAAQKEKGVQEHARQQEEHKKVVAIGEKEVNATKNYKADSEIAKRAEADKRNYTFVPEDAPKKNAPEANPSKDGAPKN